MNATLLTPEQHEAEAARAREHTDAIFADWAKDNPDDISAWYWGGKDPEATMRKEYGAAKSTYSYEALLRTCKRDLAWSCLADVIKDEIARVRKARADRVLA